MATRIKVATGHARALMPPRALSPQTEEALAKVHKLRVRTRFVACLGLVIAAARVAAIGASADGIPVLAVLLPAGLVLALLAERRLARLSVAERRVRRGGAGALNSTGGLLSWGWFWGNDGCGSADGGFGGFDGGGVDGGGGSGGDGGC